MEYILKRSKRRTVAIHIIDGEVEVRAPMRMSRREIDAFVTSKERWIREKLAKSREEVKRRKAFTLDYGDTVPCCGDIYTITLREARLPGFDGKAFCVPEGLSPEEVKAACVTIYRKLAKDYLTERTLYFAKDMGEMPASIRINSAKARWGSCSANRNINFSWRLIMADGEVIDYVVVHELAHLIEMNHSGRFWSIVEDMLPDYRKRKARLRELQKHLAAEDWG